MVIVSILLFLNANLMVFHIWLQYNSVSTYDYIVSRREKKPLSKVLTMEKLVSKNIRLTNTHKTNEFFLLSLF